MATTAYLPAGLPPMDTGVSQPGQSTAYMSAGVPGVETAVAADTSRPSLRGDLKGTLKGDFQ